jgi:hypothetical protein
MVTIVARQFAQNVLQLNNVSVVELADTRVLEARARNGHGGSNPSTDTN